jgi:hypothetical protein
MLSVKGGGRGRPHSAVKIAARKVSVPQKIKPEDIQDEEEYVPHKRIVQKRPRGSVAEESELNVPNRIAVRRGDHLHMIPGSVWTCAPFKWDPQAFGVESERLNDKIVESQIQDDSLLRFMKNPTLPLIYGVSGNPDEVQARYFAAYLAHLHAQRLGREARIVWHPIYGGYRNELIDDYKDKDSQYEPTMIILCNLASNSTQGKMEKARDILERFSTVPRVVVSAGEDPLSFLSTKMYCQCNALAYFSSSLIKRRVEVL